jgi:TonB family protein
MNENFERWEGRTVDGKFPLQTYLGGSDHSAAYLTLRQGSAGDSEKAVVKLIPADAADAEKQLLRWKAASGLSHPNLIRIFEAGRSELDGSQLLYVVEEYAEESLSQILPERALTAEETRGMLLPLLRALQYVHDRGFVHGHIQPSNILAVADQVKLSSDSLTGVDDGRRSARATSVYDPPEAAMGATSTASDVWQLGMTLVEALTQHLPAWDRARPSAPDIAELGEQLREIAENCLQVDAGKRWTVGQIFGRLESDGLVSTPTSAQAKTIASAPARPTPQKASAKWPYLLAVAALVAVAFFLIARPKPPSPPAEVQSPQSQQGATAENAQFANTQFANSQSGQARPHPNPNPSPPTPGEAKAGDEGERANAHESDVVRRVLPQISLSARRTIRGTIKVRVKVEVDAAGNVTETKLESAGPSRYFSRLALEAARNWKFSPVQAAESGTREWTLQFAFSRARTEVSAVCTKR